MFTTVDRQGVVRLWNVPLPPNDGRANQWYESALKAAELAMRNWIRLKSDFAIGAHQPYLFEIDNLPEPISTDVSPDWRVSIQVDAEMPAISGSIACRLRLLSI